MGTGKHDFEALLRDNINSIERLVYYKVQNTEDAKDIIQDVFLTAFRSFHTLEDTAKFKAWMIRIATNKCNDYYRKLLSANHVPLDKHMSYTLGKDRTGITVYEAVSETIERLGDNEKQVITLFYLKGMQVNDIAKKLNIPPGTVKSRLHAARAGFRARYPYPPVSERRVVMSTGIFPQNMPEVRISRTNEPIFPVVFEELPSWFIIPRLGQKTSWAIYDYPARTLSEVSNCEVISKARIHGVDCVEIRSGETTLYGNLTDTHVKYVAECSCKGGVKVMTTFLDEDFLEKWNCGADNRGHETNIKRNGNISLNTDGSITFEKYGQRDVLGVYDVAVGSKSFRTLRIAESIAVGLYIEGYVDRNGRTVLWRRYNRDDWRVDENGPYKKKWSENLPNNDRLIANNELYIHWYDCISDYVL